MTGSKPRTKRSYDHRIKLAIVRSWNPNLFPSLNIPRSTAKNWINRGASETVTLDYICEIGGGAGDFYKLLLSLT